MLRANKILKPLQKINPTVSLCPFYQKYNFQHFYPNQVCQLVLCEHAKSSNHLIVIKSWLYEDRYRPTQFLVPLSKLV